MSQQERTLGRTVRFSLMPKGVEHYSSSTTTRRTVVCAILFDAERR